MMGDRPRDLTTEERREARERVRRVREQEAERTARNGHAAPEGALSRQPPAASPAAAPNTMAVLLLAHLRATYEPLHGRGQAVWSRTLGRAVELREAGLGPASPLLAQLLTAADCPRDREGLPSAAGVLRVWRQHLAVAWADLLAVLPDEPEAAELDAAAEAELRRQLAVLLGRVVTIGRRLAEGRDTDVQACSLIDCCLSWAVPGHWARIRSYWLWCRLDGSEALPCDPVAARTERRRRLRVALRVELAGQLGVRPLADWPARRLTEMVEHYGLGTARTIGHQRARAVELAPDYLADLLGDPDGDKNGGAATEREPGEDR